VKILPKMCLWTRISPLDFGTHPDPYSDLGIFLRDFGGDRDLDADPRIY